MRSRTKICSKGVHCRNLIEYFFLESVQLRFNLSYICLWFFSAQLTVRSLQVRTACEQTVAHELSWHLKNKVKWVSVIFLKVICLRCLLNNPACKAPYYCQGVQIWYTPCIFSLAIYHALQWIYESFTCRFSSWEKFSQEVQEGVAICIWQTVSKVLFELK